MGQVAHEADGVGERVGLSLLGLVLAHRRVQRCKECILHERSSPGDAIEQRRLAGVGVAGDRDGWHGVAVAIGALRLTCRLEGQNLLLQTGHASVDAAAVQLDLCLTRTTASHTVTRAHLATGLAGHRLTPTAKAGKQVLQLGEFHLGLALAALGMLAKDVEDHGGAVDDLHLYDVL